VRGEWCASVCSAGGAGAAAVERGALLADRCSLTLLLIDAPSHCC
jgi:hypothetical protein